MQINHSINQAFCNGSMDLSNCMEESPSWNTGSFLASQYTVHFTESKSSQNPTLVSVLSQVSLFQVFPTDAFKIHYIIIVPSVHPPTKWPFIKFPHQNHICPLFFPMHATYLTHLPLDLIDMITQIILSEQYTSWSFSVFSFIYSFSILFLNAHSLYCFLIDWLSVITFVLIFLKSRYRWYFKCVTFLCPNYCSWWIFNNWEECWHPTFRSCCMYVMGKKRECYRVIWQ